MNSIKQIMRKIAFDSITGRKTPSFHNSSFELIRLKDSDGNLIDYDDSPLTHSMRQRLWKWNDFAYEHWIDLFISDEQWDALEEELAQRRYGLFNELIHPERLLPDLKRRRLYRVFNNGCFEQGGRFYGGGWQGVLKEYRKKYVTINGRPTVELDFSSFHPMMLYALEGLQFVGDAYRIDGIENTKSNRRLLKITFQKLVNAQPKQRMRPPRKDALPDGWDWKALQAAIMDRHQTVAHHFRSGIGVKLQRIDSDIAEAVMMEMMDRGVLVLPVHDSFITYPGGEGPTGTGDEGRLPQTDGL